MKVDLEVVRKAIDDEPEFPDGIPDDMWKNIKVDRAACEQAFRMAVYMAKIGIMIRLGDRVWNE